MLDYVRYDQQLTGTKIGCREGDCGACTVLCGQMEDGRLVYRSVTSCLMALGNASGKHIVTIEGLNIDDSLNFIQEAFASNGATQCGFCTPGFVVSMAGHCLSHAQSSLSQATDAVNGNICRCTGYKSIERAVAVIHDKIKERSEESPIQFGVIENLLPPYFKDIPNRLKNWRVSEGSKMVGLKQILGGGTDLYVQQHDKMEAGDFRFAAEEPSLKTISQLGNICQLGASVTVANIATSPIFQQHFPGLDNYIKLISSTQIRNMATIAGNIVNASPIGDLSIFFLVLDASLVLTDGEQEREVKLKHFFLGYKELAKKKEEWVQYLRFRLPPADSVFNFEKVCKRSWLDIASVNTACLLTVNNNIITSAEISAGGVGPIPFYLQATSKWLLNRSIEELVMVELDDVIQSEVKPISDVRGGAEYKRLLLSQLIKAHLLKAFPAYSNHILSRP